LSKISEVHFIRHKYFCNVKNGYKLVLGFDKDELFSLIEMRPLFFKRPYFFNLTDDVR